MPKDKTETHEKIVEVAMEEFLTKGFQQASMKSIADKVGITSAGLYRHCKDKEDLFSQLVKPALDLVNDWNKRHVDFSYTQLNNNSFEKMWDMSNGINDAGLVLDVMYQMPETFRLLVCCSSGTEYENYVHEMIEENTDEMMRFLEVCKKNGKNAKDIHRDEMHMLVSAYTSALLQPIEHSYSKQDAQRYLKTIIDFFTPGWRFITGL